MAEAMRAAALLLTWTTMTGTHAQDPPRVAAHYDLGAPTQRTELADELKEISALAEVDERVAAAVQDEAGVAYFLEHASGRIISKVPFSGAGDFEGLARVGGSLYALRSDAWIFHLGLRAGELTPLDSFQLDVPDRDIEALCYDKRNERLLILPKTGPKGAKALRDHRLIHGWDLRSGTQLRTPVLDLDVLDLVRQAEALNVPMPVLRKKDGRSGPVFQLRASAIAVHPVDDTFWILCSIDHALVVVDRSGRLIDLVHLDLLLFPQAEGLTFLANGDLLISNEGHGRPADILRFARKP